MPQTSTYAIRTAMGAWGWERIPHGPVSQSKLRHFLMATVEGFLAPLQMPEGMLSK